MAGENIFDFLRIDIDPTADDSEVLAIRQIEIALFIHIADIAGGCPAFLIVGLRGFLRLIVVVESRLLAPEVDSTGLTRGQFIAVVVHDV